jgi:hypothetical protein
MAFTFAFERLGVTEAARKALMKSGRAMAALRDPVLGDLDRERLLRQTSISLAGDVLSIGARGAGALLAGLLPLLILDLAGLSPMSRVLAWLATWPGILAATLAIGTWILVRSRSS